MNTMVCVITGKYIKGNVVNVCDGTKEPTVQITMTPGIQNWEFLDGGY